MDEKTAELKKIIEENKNIVFFGGAGVSTASGIPDFRSSNGIFSKKYNRNFTPEQLVSHTFFMNYQEEFFDFYKKNLIYPEAEPNDCHYALAELEKRGKLNAVITQNIDGLHQKAGSKVVYELHGSVLRNHCMKCHASYDVNYILNSDGIPICRECGGRVKPDVVLYEESLDENVITKAINAIKKAEIMIIGGTSLVVYPAAGLINYFNGTKMILINKGTTSADNYADLVINDDIAKVMKEVL